MLKPGETKVTHDRLGYEIYDIFSRLRNKSIQYWMLKSINVELRVGT